MRGIEPLTSSLPRKRSTPELHRLLMSGRRDSNSRPSAWKADALPTELIPLLTLTYAKAFQKNRVGRAGFEPAKSKDNRFTVCPSWPLWYLPIVLLIETLMSRQRDSNPRPADYKSA